MDQSPEDRMRLFHLLSQHEGWVETLEEALEEERKGHEEEAKGKDGKYGGFGYYGWEWYQVHTPAPTLHKMVTERVIDVVSSTRSGTSYRVRQPEVTSEVIKALKDPGTEMPKEVLPGDLLNLVVGHDNIKTIIQYAIEADKPVHLLLTGPPASSKTLFLMELARLPESYYCLAQTTSQAGLANLLFTYQPRFLLIDEIDRLTGEHIGVLNSLMATGHISESKFNKTRSMELSTKVFAAGIRINMLPRDLLSRFTQLTFQAYTEQEFIEVSTTVLYTRESVPEDLGEIIAKAIWTKNQLSSDVRACVQIARLCGGDKDKAEEILKILRRQ